jgi:hypothetical protein
MNPFENIPFIPGGAPLAKSTIPENALYQVS